MEVVTQPLEKAVAGMQGLIRVSSTSQDNDSQIVIQLEQPVAEGTGSQRIGMYEWIYSIKMRKSNWEK